MKFVQAYRVDTCALSIRAGSVAGFPEPDCVLVNLVPTDVNKEITVQTPLIVKMPLSCQKKLYPGASVSMQLTIEE